MFHINGFWWNFKQLLEYIENLSMLLILLCFTASKRNKYRVSNNHTFDKDGKWFIIAKLLNICVAVQIYRIYFYRLFGFLYIHKRQHPSFLFDIRRFIKNIARFSGCYKKKHYLCGRFRRNRCQGRVTWYVALEINNLNKIIQWI